MLVVLVLRGVEAAVAQHTGAVGAALELTSLAVSSGQMIAEEHKFNEAEKSRKEVDRDLASKYQYKVRLHLICVECPW